MRVFGAYVVYPVGTPLHIPITLTRMFSDRSVAKQLARVLLLYPGIPTPVLFLYHGMSVQRDHVGYSGDRCGANLGRFGIHRPTQKSRTARMVRINVTIYRTYMYRLG